MTTAHGTIDDLLGLARDIAISAGAMAANARADGVELAAKKSSPSDLVTKADRATEALIRRQIADARPDDAILGEEGGASGGSSGITWVVDPIDGTTNYLYGIPHYAVSIAVVEGDPDPQTWRALAAVVLNPVTGELFTATLGGGAFLRGHPIRVNEAVPLESALIGTGFAYSAGTRAEQGTAITELLPRVGNVRRMGSASLDLSFVACGRFDAYFERTLSPWDHAAGVLIASEAGAVVAGLGGLRPGHELVLAGSAGVVDQLRAVLPAELS